MAIDYIDSSGKLVRCGRVWPDVMVRTENDLPILTGKYLPGTLVFTAGHLQEWQLAADGTWVPKVALDPETAAAQAAASAQRAASDAATAANDASQAASDAATAAAQATAANTNTEGLRGWSLTKEADETVTIDYTAPTT